MSRDQEMPFLDNTVSKTENERHSFRCWLAAEHFKKEELLNGVEIEKTESDKKIIDICQKAVRSVVVDFLRTVFELPLDRIHVLKEDGVEEYLRGHSTSAGGAYSGASASIIIDRVSPDIDFAVHLSHELLHYASWQAAQTTKDNQLVSFRSGIAIYSRDGMTVWFGDFDEALTQMLTRRVYDEHLKNDKMFKDAPEPEWSRGEEERKLEELIKDLWTKNKREFPARNDVMKLFIDAQLHGRLLPLARLIDQTYGKGSFREIGEETGHKKDTPS